MNRETALAALRTTPQWDVAIVGGGATGLACAVDAATRGYRTGLVERADFAHGTSSRSTKLIHGSVRYLRQGRFGLVQSALRERDQCRGRFLRRGPPTRRARGPAHVGAEPGSASRVAERISAGRRSAAGAEDARRRVLFAVPWHARVLLGTTDTPVAAGERAPAPRWGGIGRGKHSR